MNSDQSRKYMAKMQARAQRREQVWDGIKMVLTLLVILFGFSTCTFALIHSADTDEKAKVHDIEVHWNQWIEFREQSCTLAEHSFGVTSRAGKNTVTDNIDTYNCDGVLYSTPADLHQKMVACVIDHQDCMNFRLDVIPVPG